jgi:hypothetical protein
MLYPQQQFGIQNPFTQQGAPDLQLLRQLSHGFAPVMTAPAPTLRTGFENLPGFNQPGLGGMFMQMAVAPMMSQMMGGLGMMPGGLGSQNIVDMMDAQRFQQQQQQIMGAVSGQDRSGFLRTIQGIQALTGAPMGPQQRAAAGRLASTAAQVGGAIAPFAPELVDVLAGPTGSASVMAMRMQQFNRFRSDPVTGQMGYTPDSNIEMAENVFQEMFKPGNMANMRGLRAGQMGDLYGELGRRGMLRGTDRRDALNQSIADVLRDPTSPDFDAVNAVTGDVGVTDTDIGGVASLDTDQLDKLRNLGGVQAGVRDFDASNVRQSLEGYVDVISSMREIFGDAGVTNAPIQELIAGLEALSQGTVTQVDPGSLNMMVRTTQQLARQSGMSIDAMAMMQQQGATTLEGMGVNRAFAPSITQGAVAFGMAAGDAGVFANPVWGLENADWHRQMDQNLRASATASPVNKAFGALLNASEAEGGFGADVQAAALADAIRNGQTTYSYTDKDGNTHQRHTGADSSLIEGMIIRQGENVLKLDARQASIRAGQRMSADDENLRASFEAGANNLVTRFRSDEFEDAFTDQLAGTLGGDTPEQAEKRQAAFMAAFTRMDPTNMSREGRNEQLFNALKNNPDFAGVSDAQLKDMIGTAYGQLDDAIGDSAFSAIGGAANAQVQYNRTVVEEAGFQQRLARVEGGIRDSMTGLTGQGLLSNAIQAFQDAGEDEGAADLQEFLGTTFGGVRAEEIEKRLTPAMEAFTAAQQQVEETRSAIRNTTDPAERRRLLNQLAKEQTVLKSTSDDLRTTAEEHGIFSTDDAIDADDVSSFLDTQEANRQNRLTAAGLTLEERGVDVRSEADRLGEFGITAAGGGAGDIQSLEDALVARRLAERTDKKTGKTDWSPEQQQAFRDNLRAGTLGRDGTTALTVEEQRMALEARQDQINITPSRDDVTDAMETAGLTGAQLKDPALRRQFGNMLASENRIKKTGVDTDQFEELDNEEERRKELTDLGIKGETQERMINAEREEAFMLQGTASALGESTENWRKMNIAYGDMTPEQRAIIRRGSKAEFEAVEGLIAQGRGSDFTTRAGGQGMLMLDELEEMQSEELELVRLFGGDRGALVAGSLDSATQETVGRLSQFATTSSDVADWAKAQGREIPTDKRGQALLAAEYAQSRYTEMSDRRGAIAEDLGVAASGVETYAKDKVDNVRAILRERGLPSDDAAVQKILDNPNESDVSTEINNLANSATKLYGMDQKDREALDRSAGLGKDRATLLTGRRQAAAREEAARASGGQGGLADLATAAGLKDDQRQAFIAANQGRVASAEGAEWSQALSESMELVKGSGQAALLEKALGGDAAAREELETKVGREDLGDLLNAGRVLKEGGVLDDVGKEGTDLAKALTDALKELTESKREVKDVKRQSMDITGTLKIEGKTATLAATEGLV